ncbi:hypothetical protein GCM10010170_050630 [Dactylosporangium salmoneum]|uniref:Uncharacterized protein n=1 Tax=Dactylosporangium salmoneum TaxID=53361 RepID=A0ABN3GPV3_9ACTN
MFPLPMDLVEPFLHRLRPADLDLIDAGDGAPAERPAGAEPPAAGARERAPAAASFQSALAHDIVAGSGRGAVVGGAHDLA